MEKNFIACWRPGADKIYSGKSVDAQKVAEEIVSIGGNCNLDIIEPSMVVEMARNKNTETHKLLEWDDTVAAEKYRISQVRHIMHDIQITYIKTETASSVKIEQPVRLCYNLKGETGYRPLPVILRNDDLHDKLLMTAKAELDAFKNKYKMLKELEPVFQAINSLN